MFVLTAISRSDVNVLVYFKLSNIQEGPYRLKKYSGSENMGEIYSTIARKHVDKWTLNKENYA